MPKTTVRIYKEQKVPRIEIERAVRNRANYIKNPAAHSYDEEL